MDTQSGRMYQPEEYKARMQAMSLHTGGGDALQASAEASLAAYLDEHQADFEAAVGMGRIVEVSEKVAEAQMLGNREQRRRAARVARRTSGA